MNQLQEAIEYKARLETRFHCIYHYNKWINLWNHHFWCILKNLHHETWITAFWDIEGCFLIKNANCLALPFILSNYFFSIWWQANCLLFTYIKAAWSLDTKTAHIVSHKKLDYQIKSSCVGLAASWELLLKFSCVTIRAEIKIVEKAALTKMDLFTGLLEFPVICALE